MKIILFGVLLVIAQIAQAEKATVTLHLPTMNCAMCPITVKKALTKVNGMIDAKVTYENKQARVVFDDERTNTKALIKATTEAGYPSTALEDKVEL